jgi:hypothetical protein
MSLPARWLHDLGTLALLALVVVPLYLLCNHYWQSLFRLALLYGILVLFCARLGGYMRRAMRRLPAEIPPWQTASLLLPPTAALETHVPVVEAIRSVHQDPHYVQEVLKPRLQQLLVYRLSGAFDVPLETLEKTCLARIEPALLEFFRRHEATGLWARYCGRRRRLRDVLTALQRLEAL